MSSEILRRRAPQDDRAPECLPAKAQLLPVLTNDRLSDILAEMRRRGSPAASSRRDGRADDGDGLENRCGLTVTGGSNPSPSALQRDSQGRCRSGRSGPPAKWLRGDKLLPGFESLPPRLHALVAQWIRASPCGGEGRAFESRRGCQNQEAPAMAGASPRVREPYGKILPGFRMRSGSKAARIWRMSSIWASSSASDRYRRRVAPIPCSPVIVPPSDSDSR